LTGAPSPARLPTRVFERSKLDTDRGEAEGFAARARRLLKGLEEALEADVVLIDSRAGLHETAAAAILHLDADVLLFATDQPTVWEGYRYLLAQLAQMAHSHPAGDDDWRLRLKMVYARAKQTRAALEGFRARAYQLWLDCLYDEQPAGAADDAFSFAETDDAAPHDPLVILNDPRFGPRTAAGLLGVQGSAGHSSQGLSAPGSVGGPGHLALSRLLQHPGAEAPDDDRFHLAPHALAGAPADRPEQALIEELRRIGVIRRIDDDRVDIPDLFRVAAAIGRRGGVRPIR
jgi:hypothetical protein